MTNHKDAFFVGLKRLLRRVSRKRLACRIKASLRSACTTASTLGKLHSSIKLPKSLPLALHHRDWEGAFTQRSLHEPAGREEFVRCTRPCLLTDLQEFFAAFAGHHKKDQRIRRQ